MTNLKHEQGIRILKYRRWAVQCLNRPQELVLSGSGVRKPGPRRTETIGLRQNRHNCGGAQSRADLYWHRLCLGSFCSGWPLDRFLGLVALYQQLVTDLRPAAEDRVCGEFQHALGVTFRPCDPEGAHQFPQSYHFEVLIDEHQVERKEHSNGMNC